MMNDLLPGTEVEARGLRWELVNVHPAGAQQLFRLRCLEGPLRGEEMDFLVPFERVRPISKELDPDKAAGLAHWTLYHQAFLLEQALGPRALSAAQPGRLSIAPYQLVPVMRALRMSRVRLMLADGVGLGKTVQAGLVMAELIARRRAHRILLVTPAGPLMRQWSEEMRERFGLRFDLLDRDRLQAIRYQNELGANPFDHVQLGLISIDFAKQERVLSDIERSQYDLVVIDEAHHCMSLGSSGDREDSQRRRLAEVLSRRTDGLLLLTATPHDGHDPHFASLMELLDPSLVDGRGALRGDAYRGYVVRRLKRHIKDPVTGEAMFPTRKVEPVKVALDEAQTPTFARLQRELLELLVPLLRRAMKRRRYDDVLAFLALLKRSVSSAAACARTLGAVSERLRKLESSQADAHEERKQRIRTLRELQRKQNRFGAQSYEEEEDAAQLEAEEIADELAELDIETKASRREQRSLKELRDTRARVEALADLAKKAQAEDPKLAAVLTRIREIRAQEPRANVLVYTEYADSQRVLAEHLAAACERGALTGAVLQISGADDEDDRVQASNRFRAEDDLVLVSTDATAEGLNLHDRCHHLVHLELPYNPNRLEQRNGRIDRFGQKHTPQISYLYLAGTFEERLLLRLVDKYERQRRRLTFVPDTLGLATGSMQVQQKLLEGLAGEQQELFRTETPLELGGEAVDDVRSEAYRDLLGELDRAIKGYEAASTTMTWLGAEGAYAGPKNEAEAVQAREAGARQGAIDLAQFVADVLQTEQSNRAYRKYGDHTWELRIPRGWVGALDGVPGLSLEGEPILRITDDPAQYTDEDGHPVGFLGRAHPLVRLGIDRVRNQRYGSDRGLDRRVSAARIDEPEPGLLVTFLGRVQSRAGRELERVIAVRVSREGEPLVMLDHEQWAPLTSPERHVNPAGKWKLHFASWAEPRRALSAEHARDAFDGLVDAWRADYEADLMRERSELEAWLRQRADQIVPKFDRQLGLDETRDVPAWALATDPLDRLSAFADDATQRRADRGEAKTVVKLALDRRARLEARADLAPPELLPLGLLMLVPEER